MSVVDSFLVSLLFDEKQTQVSADKVNAITKNMVKSVIGAVAVFASYSFLKGAINEFADGSIAAGKFADSVHSDIEAVDALCQSIARIDGDVEGFKGTLSNLNSTIKESSQGKGDNVQVFKKMGIALKDLQGNVRDTDQVLLDLSDKLSVMNDKQQIDIASKLGIDKNTLEMMKQGKASLEEVIRLRRADGVVTAKQVAMSKEYKTLLWDLDNAYKQVKNKLAEAILPWVNKFLGVTMKLTNYLRKHKGLVIGFFGGLATIITTRAIPAILKLSAAMLANPLTWMIAGVVALGAAIALLVDDFITWKDGGESAFGDFWAILEPTIGAAIEGFKDMANALLDLYRVAKPIIDALAYIFLNTLNFALESVIGTFIGVMDTAKWVFNSISEIIKTIVALINGDIDGFAEHLINVFGLIGEGVVGSITSMRDMVNNILKGMLKIIGVDLDKIGEYYDKFKNLFSTANNPNTAQPNAGLAVANTTNNTTANNRIANNNKTESVSSTTTVQKVEVNVQNGDPQKIASGISGALQKNLAIGFNNGFTS